MRTFSETDDDGTASSTAKQIRQMRLQQADASLSQASFLTVSQRRRRLTSGSHTSYTVVIDGELRRRVNRCPVFQTATPDSDPLHSPQLQATSVCLTVGLRVSLHDEGIECRLSLSCNSHRPSRQMPFGVCAIEPSTINTCYPHMWRSLPSQAEVGSNTLLRS